MYTFAILIKFLFSQLTYVIHLQSKGVNQVENTDGEIWFI